MSKPIKCALCGKVIKGYVSVIIYQKRVGKIMVAVTELYDDACFQIKSKVNQ